MKEKLIFDSVKKLYGSFAALDDVSIQIDAGEFMTLLGPSGSGKTTLLMTIAGFVEPTSGDVTLDGTRITHLPPERRNFGVVFQGYALFPHMTVWGNVGYPLRVRGMSRNEAETKIRGALDLIQLSHLADRYPKQLSGGQQQRVALARSLVFSPELLLLDEPLSALDRALRKDLQLELKDLHERVGTTFIYVTHDQEEALSMSDRIAILRDGRIEQLGTPEGLYEKPNSIFVANFLGKSNFLPAQIVGKNGAAIKYEVGGFEFNLKSEDIPELHGDISVALRPERLSLRNDEDTSPTINSMPGQIRKVSYFGKLYEVIVATDAAGDIMVTADLGCRRPRVGETVWISWSESAGVLLTGRPSETDDAYAG